MDVYISRTRPERPLATLTLGQYCDSRIYLHGVPPTSDTVKIRLARPTASTTYFEATAVRLPSGVWRADVTPAQAPDTGSAVYVVMATEGSRNAIVLGKGTAKYVSYDATTVAAQATAPSCTVYDESGHAHTLRVVSDGEGGYTTIVED